MRQKEAPMWTVPFLLILLSSLLLSVVNNLLIPVLPAFTKHLGGDSVALGRIIAVFSVAAMITRPASGNLADRIGRRPVMLAGMFIFLAGTLLHVFANSLPVLMALRFVQGVGFAAISTGTGTMVADLVPHNRLSEGISYYSTSVVIGTAFGPSLGLHMLRTMEYPPLFLILGFIVAASLAVSWFINYEKKNPERHALPEDEAELSSTPSEPGVPGYIHLEGDACCGGTAGKSADARKHMPRTRADAVPATSRSTSSQKAAGPVSRQANAAPASSRKAAAPAAKSPFRITSIIEFSSIPSSLVLMFVSFTFASTFSFLPAFALAQGIADSGIFYTVYAVSTFIIRLFAGRIARVVGPRNLIVPSLGLLTASLVLLPMVTTSWMLAGIGVLYGCGFGLMFPVLNAIVIDLCPPDRKGAANATFSLALDIGNAVGSILWGQIIAWTGYAAMYLGSAICAVLAAVMFLTLQLPVLLRREREQETNSIYK